VYILCQGVEIKVFGAVVVCHVCHLPGFCLVSVRRAFVGCGGAVFRLYGKESAPLSGPVGLGALTCGLRRGTVLAERAETVNESG
jgi:hypothetical protein